MTNQHPMLPTQKQLDNWNLEYYDGASLFDEVTTQAFQWGADCQLEKVIEWLEEKGLLRYVYGEHAIIDTDEVVADLKKAMRPQEDQ